MSTTQQPEALRDARWYMVNKDGMATLCTDREDAEKEAEDAQIVWPHMGPHRAVQLVESADVEAMRAAQPAGAQQPDTAYAELPSYEHQRAIMEAERNASLDEYSRIVPLTSTESMIYERAFTNGWNRNASHGQAPAQPAPQQAELDAVAGQDVMAWMTQEGDRVVTARTMGAARRGGGAMLSSLRDYSVALVRANVDAAMAAQGGK